MGRPVVGLPALCAIGALGRRHAVGLSLLAALALSATPLGAVATAQAAHAAPDPAPALKVQGNQLVDTNTGLPVQLHGVDRSGTEYQCVHNVGIFDPVSPSTVPSTTAIASWRINAVRVPLNEDCWLGINGVNPAYAGPNYQQAIAGYVNYLNAAGLVAILDLHWSAPGTQLALGQQPMPDQDHSVDFWRSVATTAAFANNPSVVFDLFNEPSPGSNRDTPAAWRCWRDGGSSCHGLSFQAAGMQELVNTVRAAGASNAILLGGVRFANALSRWLAYEPTDPAGNLAASWHAYDFNSCNTLTCWNQTVAPVAAKVPVVTGEFGEKNQGPQFVWCGSGSPNPTCNSSTGTGLLPWLDSRGISYIGWTWDAWNSWDSLITDYNGTPNGGTFSGVVAYGATYFSYLNR